MKLIIHGGQENKAYNRYLFARLPGKYAPVHPQSGDG